MKIAITDANIFIDLIKLQWLGYLFSIDIEIHTTLEVINELIDTQLERVTVFIKSFIGIRANNSNDSTCILNNPG